MAHFGPAVDIILAHEGVDSDHPADTGGRTRFGISAAAYPHLDIASLTLDQAKDIYQRDYWDRLRLDDVDDQEIATYLLDLGVNAGVIRAALLAQKACNYYGANLHEDGVIGPHTLHVLNRIPANRLMLALIVARGHHYMTLVQARRQNTAFSWGWMRRAFYPVADV